MSRRSSLQKSAWHRRRSAANRNILARYYRSLRIEPLEDRRLLAVVTVDTLDDTIDLGDGRTSLREAIFATNLVSGPDTIEFAPSLTAVGPATILLTGGELRITDALTISGPGASRLTIDASGSDPTPDENNGDGSRVFDVNDLNAASQIDVSISHLTMTGGDVVGSGGSIRNRENLTLIGTTVSGNSAIGADSATLSDGGGISHRDGALTVMDSRIAENFADFGGGVHVASGTLLIADSEIANNTGLSGAGIYQADGSAVVERSTIRNNIAPSIFALGGGIYTSGSMTVESTTISGNTAAYGGGIFSRTDTTVGESTRIVNSTISGNTALVRGGGVRNALGQTVIEHSTITANSAPAGQGGGVASRGYATSRTIVRSTIIAGNISSDVAFATGSVNSFESRGFNLIGTGNAVAAFQDFGDVTGVINPLLGPLADNGGPTLTHVLLAGSPAINAGDLAAIAGEEGVPIDDQRGAPFGRVFNGRIDIGAFEYQAASDLNLLVDTLEDESDGDYSRGDLSLREAIELANLYPSTDTIHFDASLTAAGPATILLTHGELRITDDATINGPGADLLTIDASGNDPTPEVNDRNGSRVLRIDDGNVNVVKSATISGVTLTGGDIYGNGGAILSSENLTITNSTISGNAISGDSRGFGGGIYSGQLTGFSPIQLTVQDSSITHNSTNRFGGGIATNRSVLTVFGSTIRENSADSGGGISSRSGTATITSSSIDFNSARRDGGGLHRNGGITTVTYTTFGANSAASGGGIVNFLSALTVQDSWFFSNFAEDGDGGAISNRDGNLTVVASFFHTNVANRDGGAVFGQATIKNSEINFNFARRNGGGMSGNLVVVTDSEVGQNIALGHGGGIHSLGASLSVIRSTISGNAAEQNGGGIFHRAYDYYDETLIQTSTISGNRANSGGGLYIFRTSSPDSTIQHSTITNNVANVFGGGVAFIGTGLALDHTIVANNLGTLGVDVAGLLNTSIFATHSLIGTSVNTGLAEAPVGSPDAEGNLIGGPIHGAIDPHLDELADNGGPTMTHALLPGSPAINMGDPAAMAGVDGVPLHDQRGEPFVRVYGRRIDIGAFELQPVDVVLGDYNGDGVVDAGDATVWRDALGSTSDLRADGNGDGVVNQADYVVWKSNFGSRLAAGAVLNAVVRPAESTGVAASVQADEAVLIELESQTLPQNASPAVIGNALTRISAKPPAADKPVRGWFRDQGLLPRSDAALIAWLDSASFDGPAWDALSDKLPKRWASEGEWSSADADSPFRAALDEALAAIEYSRNF